MARVEIPITDEFDHHTGEFDNYDAIPADQRAQLLNQKHVNLRSFIGDATTFEDISIKVSMLFLDSLTMNGLTERKMNVLSADFDAEVVVRQGERWTAGTSAVEPTRKNWRSLTIECAIGTNTTSSVIIN